MSESAVESELVKLTKVRKKKNEEEQTYLSRMVTKVTALDDDTWEKMSAAAQEWSNVASKAFNKDEEIPPFPVDESEEEDEDEDEEGEEDEDGDDDAGDGDEDDDDDDADEDDDDDDDDAEEEEEVKPKGKKASKAPAAKVKEKPAAKKKEEKKKEEKKPAPKKTSSKKAEPEDDDDDADDDDGDEDEKSTKSSKSDDKKKKGIQKPAAEVGEAKKPRGGGVAIKEIMVKDPNISLPDLVEKLQKKGFGLTEFTVSSIRSEFRQTLKVLNELGCLSEELVKRLAKKKSKD